MRRNKCADTSGSVAGCFIYGNLDLHKDLLACSLVCFPLDALMRIGFTLSLFFCCFHSFIRLVYGDTWAGKANGAINLAEKRSARSSARSRSLNMWKRSAIATAILYASETQICLGRPRRSGADKPCATKLLGWKMHRRRTGEHHHQLAFPWSPWSETKMAAVWMLIWRTSVCSSLSATLLRLKYDWCTEVGKKDGGKPFSLKPINFPQLRLVQPHCVQALRQLWHDTNLEDMDPLFGVQGKMPPNSRQFFGRRLAAANRLQSSGSPAPVASK